MKITFQNLKQKSWRLPNLKVQFYLSKSKSNNYFSKSLCSLNEIRFSFLIRKCVLTEETFMTSQIMSSRVEDDRLQCTLQKKNVHTHFKTGENIFYFYLKILTNTFVTTTFHLAWFDEVFSIRLSSHTTNDFVVSQG